MFSVPSSSSFRPGGWDPILPPGNPTTWKNYSSNEIEGSKIGQSL